MREFNHIEALWAAHTVEVKISSDEMLKQAKKEVSSMRTKSLLNMAVMTLAMIAMTCLWFFDFKSWTTHAGISIIIIAIGVFTVVLYYNYRIIGNSDFTANPTDFISRLKRYQLNRHALHSRLYWFYAVALSVGMILYFFELADHLSVAGQIAFVTLSFGWTIFCSTLVRKAVIKRDRERIALLIEKFERLSEQLKDNQ